MATASLRLVTDRDMEALNALDHCPLTARQMLRFSQTFASPFTTERRVRDRFHLLSEAGRVRRWQYYATAGQGAPNYYTLSRLGYHILHGEDAPPPTKRAFSEIGLSRQRHTFSHAEFLVHTIVAAHSARITFTDFHRENTLRLTVGEDCLYPDNSFQLIDQGQAFHFFTEIDGGGERISSPKEIESWERKIRFYDRLQDLTPTRFRVLAISVRSSVRIGHILTAAASLMRNPNRSLIYGITLPDYLATTEPLRSACFRDHRGNQIALAPHAAKRSQEMGSAPGSTVAFT